MTIYLAPRENPELKVIVQDDKVRDIYREGRELLWAAIEKSGGYPKIEISDQAGCLPCGDFNSDKDLLVAKISL